MCKGWDQTDERIRNGLYDDRLPTYRLLCEELTYYERKIEDIEYEISRRTWLRWFVASFHNKLFLLYYEILIFLYFLRYSYFVGLDICIFRNISKYDCLISRTWNVNIFY